MNRNTRQEILDALGSLSGKGLYDGQRHRLGLFEAMIRFELLLDRTVRAMSPGCELRDAAWKNGVQAPAAACRKALDTLRTAPVEELIETYVSRTESRGEMGILSSINQRLWNNYLRLEEYLTDHSK